MIGGKKNWYFADGYLPEKNPQSALEAHEALMLFNTQSTDAAVKIDVYFCDREPIRNIAVTVPAERIIALRLDHPEDLNGTVIPVLTQYALRLRSNVPLVVQFGRLDTTQANMAYYLGVGWCE